MNIVDVLDHQARTQAHAPAFVTRGAVISYAEAAERVRRTAAALAASGIAAGDRVALRLPNSPVHFIVLLALARLGATAVPVHPLRPPATLQGFAQRFGLAAAIGLDAKHAIEGTRLILADDALLQPIDAQRHAEPNAAGDDTPLSLALSSGTTGATKAIAWTHQRTLRHWEQLQRLRPHGPGVRLLVFMGFDGNYPTMAGLRQLFSGGTLVVVPDVSLRSLVEAVDHLGANHVISSPALIGRLIEQLPADRQRLPHLASLRLSGSSVAPALMARMRRRLCSNICLDYGTTELGAMTHGERELLELSPQSVGRVIPSVQAQAVDDDGQPLPVGTSGVLRFRSDGMPLAYLDDAQASQKMFRDGWFYPGDRGQVHADGTLVIESRVDEIINVGGTKVNPSEVEQVLLEDPDIVDAAAYGVTDAAGRMLLLAAIVCRQPVDEQRTLARCRAVLGQKSPRRLVRLARLPRNDAGKVLRRELAANTRVGPAAAQAAEPAA